MGKSGPNATFKPFFSGLGWPWVGECVGFILIFTCFPTPQNLVNCKTPYYINNSVRWWKAYKENAFFHFRSAGTDLRLHEVQKGHLLTTKCHLFTVKRPPVHYDTSPVHDQMPPVYCEWAPVHDERPPVHSYEWSPANDEGHLFTTKVHLFSYERSPVHAGMPPVHDIK